MNPIDIEKLAAEAGADVEAMWLAWELMGTLGGTARIRHLIQLLDQFNAALNPLLATLSEADRETLCLVLVGVSRHVLLTAMGKPAEQWPDLIERSTLITRILDWGQQATPVEAPNDATWDLRTFPARGV